MYVDTAVMSRNPSNALSDAPVSVAPLRRQICRRVLNAAVVQRWDQFGGVLTTGEDAD